MDLSLHLLLPEMVVVATARLVVAADLVAKDPAKRRALAPAISAVGLLAALLVLLLDPREGPAVHGHFVVDAFSRFARGLALGGGVLVTAIAAAYTRRMDRGHGEFYALMLFALTGVLLVAGVADLMSLFVSLELVTVSSYVLAAFKRNDPRSTEAGLKYLVIGAVSSAVLLFGSALVYGAAGTVEFAGLSAHAAAKGFSPLLSLGTTMLLAGLFFKASAVPFQVWAPDVYQGAPTPITAFLATLSKSAGFVLLLRVMQVLVVPAAGQASAAGWTTFLGVVAVATILYGNLGAIPQKDVKRLFAYSSIGHAGYLLTGVAAVASAPTPAAAQDGAAAVLFYLLAYYVTTATAFAVVACVSAEGRGHGASVAYAGLARRSPLLGFAMLLALLSLAGVPPMAGLIGKFLVFYAVVERGLYVVALVGAAAVVVSLYYYLLLIRQMYVAPSSTDAPTPLPWPARVAVAVGIAVLVGLGIWWRPAFDASKDAARALFPDAVPATSAR
jgi:NADH-quinone oxidoreductase subunit N